MRARTFDDVVEIIKPDPDSQYRLTPCDCGSGEVVYARYITPAGALLWRVVCTDCGAVADLRGDVRHDVQCEWNRRNKHGKIDRTKRHYGDLHRQAHQDARR